jgi:hypothetical protein
VAAHILPQLAIRRTALGLCAIACSACSGAEHPGYTIHNIMDTNGGGGLAMTYEIPKGWTALDKILWNTNLRLNPMSYNFSTGDPKSGMWLSVLSGLTFDFDRYGNGPITGKAPPAQASDFLMQDFTSSHPNNPQYTIESKEDKPIPYPMKPTVPGVSTVAYQCSVTVVYDFNGKPWEEKLTMDFYGYSQHVGANRLHGNWFVSGLCTVNAPQGHLHDIEVIANNVFGSERMTKSFANKYQEVCQMLLNKTKQENQEILRQRAQRVIVTGGGARAMDKDEFILHENIRSLKCHIFNYEMGN